jgi:hypothetical protein
MDSAEFEKGCPLAEKQEINAAGTAMHAHIIFFDILPIMFCSNLTRV